jgi:small basic protein
MFVTPSLKVKHGGTNTNVDIFIVHIMYTLINAYSLLSLGQEKLGVELHLSLSTVL